MSEPKRLIEEGTAIDRALLRAGREERPTDDYERRVLAAASALPAASTAATQPSSLLSRLVRPQYLAAVVAIGVGAAVLSTATFEQDAKVTAAPTAIATTNATSERAEPSPDPSPPPSPESHTEVVGVMTPDALPSAPASAPVAARASAAAPALAAPARSLEEAPRGDGPAVTGTSLQREVELLDSVKRSLRASANQEAARTLDDYDAEFPSGTLKPEAGFLRIRLLLARGERARAVALGDELRAKYPNSVHARRIQAALAADAATPSQDQASPR